jgi:hypothetical protein
MNEAILQIWEESILNDVIRQDGCSIHLNSDLRNKYINSYYLDIGDEVPDSYERAVGEPCDVIVNDDLYRILKEKGSIRLMQNELNNLFSMDDIILKKD